MITKLISKISQKPFYYFGYGKASMNDTIYALSTGVNTAISVKEKCIKDC